MLPLRKLKFFVVVVTRPLARDGVVAKDHEASETGQLPKAWIRGRRQTKSRQRASGARSRSWTVQSEMRGVLGRVSTGAAGRILDSANPREIRT